MAEHNQLGKQGEEIALKYLRKKGYKVLFANFRLRHMEVDIICQDKEELVFIEVKTRSRFEHADPEDIITNKHMNNLFEVAEDYVVSKNWEGDTRFDAIIVVMKNPIDIEHIEGAFGPNY